MECSKWKIYVVVFVGIMVIFSAPNCYGFTHPPDILAIKSLYAALCFPPLPGWLLAGGDPCSDGWQGVQCVDSNITAIVLNGADLGGELGENLGAFASIMQIDLSNNHIGGRIPSNLPLTIKNFFLSGNQLTGSIPDSFSMLAELTDFSLNNNHLTGEIPDSFQQLSALANLDLSANNLTGRLPPSMVNLLSLTTLRLQDNRLTGVLDVLQDLPLIDLDVENNLFSGPVPPKLLSIPDFRGGGNPFNTTVVLSPRAPSPQTGPGVEAFGPPPPLLSGPPNQRRPATRNTIVVWVASGGFVALVLFAFGLCFCVWRRRKEKSKVKAFKTSRTKDSTLNVPSSKPSDRGANVCKSVEEHTIDVTKRDVNPLPPPLLAGKPVDVPTAARVDPAGSFSIASLQQYTNSFSQENLVGRGTIGAVYRAELPDGKLLAVKKLDDAAWRQWSDKDFVELASNVSKIRHENVAGLEGYCVERGQRLFVYGYCRNGTLHEALHVDVDDGTHERLSWNARVHLALQAARALEYLHEVCKPPVVHQNFKSANLLLDDDLNLRVSDCGLAPLMPSSYVTQLQGLGYGAPELEHGSYGYPSDVYSFGVVMLELLTGRKPYDRSRPRGEQLLVKWASDRLHEIEALSSMVDPSLNATYSSKSVSRFADIISLCVQAEPEFRPPVSEIVQNLLHMIQRNV